MRRPIHPFVLVVTVLVGFVGGIVPEPIDSQEIGFLEEWALAEDRTTVLDQLVPGTEDYYFFHCLHYQQTEQLDKVDALLEPWIRRFPNSTRIQQIRNRQSLLRYSDDPALTLSYLRQELQLNFNHQREIPATQRDLPTTLDAELISEKSTTATALERHKNTDGFTADGLALLATVELNSIQLRHLLQRIEYPDFPHLVDLVARNLKEPDSPQFGQLEIHKSLTLQQLDEVAKKYPALGEQAAFVNIYLTKLAPRDEINWLADVAAHKKYLDRLWKFVKDLPPSHNSLKANILFGKLDLARRMGEFDRELFIVYLQLPRQVDYINPVLLKSLTERNQIADLNQDYSSNTKLVPVLNDEPLVQELLQHFLLDAADTNDFQPYIESGYLRKQFATVKILNELGDTERWASMLSPAEYQQLLNRIDLEFVATNPEQFGVDDEVQLGLHTKNIKTLLVKIFEINTANYYRQYGTEIDTNVSLDGLVPNLEQSFQYDDAPALRVKREFKFPQLNKRGVYVVDFIAGGKSSRALIRKGRLQIVQQTTAAGQLFSVLDQAGAVVTDASLWISGRRFHAIESGKILVPFSTQLGSANAIISQGDFSCLQVYKQAMEFYQFTAAMVIDRESLVRSNTAKILIRPRVLVADGELVPLALLKQPQLLVTTINRDDIASTKIFDELKFDEFGETVCEFVVPPRLKSLTLKLTAKIENNSQSKTVNLSANQTFDLNKIDGTPFIQDLHLAPTDSGYVIEILGKTGEPRPKQPVRLNLKLRNFTDEVTVDLQSDGQGQIHLGQLPGVYSVKAKLVNGPKKTWSLMSAAATYPQTINGLTTEDISVPAPADLTKLDRGRIALFERRRETFVADWFNAVSLENGLLKLKRLKAGNYLLRIAGSDRVESQNITIHVVAGTAAANVLFGEHRLLENRTRSPLAIQSLTSDAEVVTLKLTNSSPTTRVHVFADRYQPKFQTYESFAQVIDRAPWLSTPAIRKSVYVEGRKIGDEYQYILDRKFGTKYPGNMLTRPSLLLNPWATQETDSSTIDAAAGSEFQKKGNEEDRTGFALSMIVNARSDIDFANLDYLGNRSVLLENLQPNQDGTLIIERKKLGLGQHIRVIALDRFSTIQRSLEFPLAKIEPRDGRLAAALKPDQHFTQSKQVQVLAVVETLTIADIVSAKFQAYDDLRDVYRLLLTLNPNSDLRKFEFILTWDELDEARKQTLYSEHACHELNFWLLKKDQPFFETVVAKHLANKRDKTFFDRWLLNEALDEFTDPWRYARLNAFERILLSQRLETQSADIVRNINEMYQLSPTPCLKFDALYDTSIRGLGLDGEEWESRVETLRLESLQKGGSMPLDGKSTTDEPESSLSDFSAKFDEDVSLAISPDAGAVFNLQVVESESLSGGEVPLRQMMREESRTRDIPVTRSRIENRERTLADGTKQKFPVAVPYTESVTQNYTVQVPYSEQEADLFATQQDLDLKFLQGSFSSARFFRRLPPTEQWMENNYFHLLPENQTPDLVPVNRFWKDYANHTGSTFLSPNFPEAHHTFTEMMFVLSVLDLPLKAKPPVTEYNENQLHYTANSPTIAFHQQVESAIVEQGHTTVLVSENFFAVADRYRL